MGGGRLITIENTRSPPFAARRLGHPPRARRHLTQGTLRSLFTRHFAVTGGSPIDIVLYTH